MQLLLLNLESQIQAFRCQFFFLAVLVIDPDHSAFQTRVIPLSLSCLKCWDAWCLTKWLCSLHMFLIIYQPPFPIIIIFANLKRRQKRRLQGREAETKASFMMLPLFAYKNSLAPGLGFVLRQNRKQVLLFSFFFVNWGNVHVYVLYNKEDYYTTI